MDDTLRPSEAALEMVGDAAVSHISLLTLIGDPPLDMVLRLLLLETSMYGEAGAKLYDQMRKWVEACQMASVGEARLRVQLARAVWSLHTQEWRDDPDFTRVPRRARRCTL